MQNPSHTDQLEYEQEISFKPLLKTLWSYRRAVAAGVSAIFILFVFVSLLAYLVAPSEHQGSLEFRVLFDGADKGQYPNGLPFSRSDIIGTPVLTAVYLSNDLKRYCSYDDFKNHIFILESSRDLELLDLEYRGKLADTRLSSVDRSKLESEFREKEESLKVAQYRIVFQSPNRSRVVPDALLSKVLNDVLSTWADQAVNLRGILNYQVRLYTPNVLQREFIDSEDYFVRLDIIRDKINRILLNVDSLLKLPGANLIRVGENKISLPEVRANLEDIRQFKVEPLVGLVWKSALSQDPTQLIRYAEARVSQLKLDEQEAVGRVKTIQDALSTYMRDRGAATTTGNREGSANSSGPAAVPQLSESFLDRLVAISSQSGDVQYRQRLTDQIILAGQTLVGIQKDAAYYEDLESTLRRSSPVGRGTLDRETAVAIGKRFDEIYASVTQAVQQIDGVYLELSRHNLGPSTNLFTITRPLSITTERALTFEKLGLYGVLTLMLSFFVIPLVCIIHHYFRREIAPREDAVLQTANGEKSLEEKTGRPYVKKASV